MNKYYIMEKIKQLQKKSLSSSDILKLCGNKTNLMTYPELVKYDNINDVLGKYGCCVILYETRKGYGHWICVIRHNKKNIEFFDPYGLMPDDQLKWIPMHFRKINNELHSHLTYLLLKSGCKIEYNHDKLQKMINDVNTCGRWVCMRIILRDWPLKKFVKEFKNQKYSPDVIVTALTSFI